MADKSVKPNNPADINPCFLPDGEQNPGEYSPCILPDGSQNPAEFVPCVLPEGSQNPAEVVPCVLPNSNQNPAEYIPCIKDGGGSAFLPAVQKLLLFLLGLLGLLVLFGLFGPPSLLLGLGQSLVGMEDWEKMACPQGESTGSLPDTLREKPVFMDYNKLGDVEAKTAADHKTGEIFSAMPLNAAFDGSLPDFFDDALFALFKALHSARMGLGLVGFLPLECDGQGLGPPPPPPPPGDDAPTDTPPVSNTCGDGLVGDGEMCDGTDLTQCFIGQVCSKCQCVQAASQPTGAPTVCEEHCEGSTLITADCVPHEFNPACMGGGCPCTCDPATGRCADCNRNQCTP